MGPLDKIRVVEFAGLGPAPFCGMVLADLGADVIRIDRASLVTGAHTSATRYDFHNRGKSSIGVDLKQVRGQEVVLRLVQGADALIEGFRPGVMERLGIGPAACLARNPRLVYGRMTGWGQEGPLVGTAGHDIDYIAISGVLGAIGDSQPIPPLNLVADFGGGGMVLAVGVLAGILSARASGEGQVVDAAMVDGSALLSTSTHGYLAEGVWTDARRSNFLDGAAPYYTVYQTSDGGFVAVGALEPQFFEELLSGLGLRPGDVGEQTDREAWPEMRRLFEQVFRAHPRAHWEELFSGIDACVAPVLTLREAPEHPHNVARSTFVTVDDVVQPGPAPRFTGTPTLVRRGPSYPGRDTDRVLSVLGYSPEDIGMLKEEGVVA